MLCTTDSVKIIGQDATIQVECAVTVTDYPIREPDNADDLDIEEELKIPDDKGRERSTARWLALQILYELDSTDHPRGLVMSEHTARYTLQQKTRDYTYKLVNGVLDNVNRLDMIIQTVAQEYPLDQIATIDRNILRIGVYEYSMLANLPVGVVVDEAVWLSTEFGADTAPRFINGVLGELFSNEERLEAMLAAEMPTDDEYYDDDFDDFEEDDD